MSTSFTRTREQLRDKVYGSMGVYDPDDGVTASDAALFYEALDLQLKSLHRLGVLWWKVSSTTTDVTLTSGDGTEDAPTDMLYMVDLIVRSGSTDSPVEIITNSEYQDIENKSDSGLPNRAYVDQEGQKIFLHPIPDSAYTLKETYAKIADDSATGTAPDIPVWGFNALVDLLKFDLADSFGISEEKISRWGFSARKAMKDLRIMNAPKIDHTVVKVINY